MAHKVKNSATVNWAVQLELEDSSIAAYLKFSVILKGPGGSGVYHLKPHYWCVTRLPRATPTARIHTGTGFTPVSSSPFVYSQAPQKQRECSKLHLLADVEFLSQENDPTACLTQYKERFFPSVPCKSILAVM